MVQAADTDLFALQFLDIANLWSGIEPEQGPFESGKEHAQIGAAEVGGHGRRGNAGKFNFTAHERKIAQGARHLDQIDIESLFFVVAPLLGREKYDLGYVVTGNGDSDSPGLRRRSERKSGQKQGKQTKQSYGHLSLSFVVTLMRDRLDRETLG